MRYAVYQRRCFSSSVLCYPLVARIEPRFVSRTVSREAPGRGGLRWGGLRWGGLRWHRRCRARPLSVYSSNRATTGARVMTPACPAALGLLSDG